MSTSIESVTAASKLRREKKQVKEELTAKRKACKELMEQVRRREEDLRAERAELQEQLVKFYKYIQDNEMKRAHHNKKAQGEERAKQERHAKILELTEQSKQLERDKIEVRRRVARLQKYETYLSDVLQHHDTEEFTEPAELMERFHKLDGHRKILKQRQEQLQDELAKAKVSLALRHQRNKGESVELELKLNELQSQYSRLQKETKDRGDDLDQEVTQKGDTKRSVGQMRMACGNLYDRCVSILEEYRGARKTKREESSDMLGQLTVIGNCLSDLIDVVTDWKKMKASRADETFGSHRSPLFSSQRRAQAAQQSQMGASSTAGGGAASGNSARRRP